MSLEEAAKLVISGGLVTPAYTSRKKRPGRIETLNPPSAA
jgi:uncharacterized membrane protein